MALALSDSIGDFSMCRYIRIFDSFNYSMATLDLLTISNHVASNCAGMYNEIFPDNASLYASRIMHYASCNLSHIFIQAYVPSYRSLSVDSLRSPHYVYLSFRLSSKLVEPWRLSL